MGKAITVCLLTNAGRHSQNHRVQNSQRYLAPPIETAVSKSQLLQESLPCFFPRLPPF
jgi:hypothetical protein